MEYLVTGNQAKMIDAFSIHETGIPSLVLMERASLCVAEEVMILAEKLRGRKSRIGCVCGNGNNGGDGICAGRILFQKGYRAEILLAGDRSKLSEDEKIQLGIAEKLGMTVHEHAADLDYDVIIDAIFGIGLTRDVKGSFAEVIDAINQVHEEGAVVVAVDIPSGISSDTGRIMGTAVKADVTVTFGYRKIGMIDYPGASCCGKIVCREIGFDTRGADIAGVNTYTYGLEDLNRIPKRLASSNKGTYGKVLVIAGTKNMAGAACFSAASAYKTGAGLVYLYTPESNRVILQQLIPEAVMKTYPDGMPDLDDLDQVIKGMSVVVLGPGLGTSKASEAIVAHVLKTVNVPMIIDADALNILACHKEWLENHQASVCLTPHLMELSRLTGYNIQSLKENLDEICVEFRNRYDVICISKDARTRVFDGSGRLYINTSGNNGMSTGGSGDVLTGIIAGLTAQKMPLGEAAVLGTYIHGLAGDEAARIKSPYAMTATDLISSLSQVFRLM